jgi:23S rRNA (pseudouridine1915-N3)-methyltransferase
VNLFFYRTGRGKQDAVWNPLISSYLNRTRPYANIEESLFPTEERLLLALDRRPRSHFLILCDSKGKQLSSEQFAGKLQALQLAGQQEIVLCIGPADGFSDTARKRADLLVSFGPITLPHQLAALVLAEQLYRAFTILAGHPYHSGH